MTSIKTVLKNILEWIIGADRSYSAAWTATSSNAIHTQLTDSVTLPKGTYVIVVTSPTVQTAAVTIGLRVGGSMDLASYATFPVNSHSKATYIMELTAASTAIFVTAEQSASVTFANITRGSLKAVRVAG